MKNKDILIDISNEFKESINVLEVISPDAINSIYATIASKYNLSILDINENINTYYHDKLAELENISQQTTKNIAQLDSSTQKAITAIEAKDESTLAEVLAETQKLKEEIKELKCTIYKDELTKAYNRKWLNDNFLSEDKFTKSGVLAIVDMNYFKEINDSFGHIAGDKALQYVVSKLQNVTENVVRYGGDEFIVLFDSLDSTPVAVKRELVTLRDKMKAKKLKYLNTEFRLTFSVGVVGFKEGDNFASKLDSADEMMYEDKKVIKKVVKGIN